MEFTVDGSLNLQDQQNTLNHTEMQGVLQLVSYESKGDEDPHVNLATFEDRDITVVLPPLTLTESADGSDCWVSGELAKVSVNR
ncbi:MAG: hypothetical protein QOK48_257 [Blastocatellia bacterium]|jgi:hypothetical protein|nr:hypothetical protein [Blastocatellia bacterium]